MAMGNPGTMGRIRYPFEEKIKELTPPQSKYERELDDKLLGMVTILRWEAHKPGRKKHGLRVNYGGRGRYYSRD